MTSAPNSCAKFSRCGGPPVTMICSAPACFATASAAMPTGPEPWTTTTSPHCNGTPLNSVDGGRQARIRRRRPPRWERIRDAEDRRSCAEMDLFRVAATQMGSFIGVVGNAVRLASEAARRLRLQTAVKAFAACDGARPADAIADLQRIAAPILLQPFAELLDDSDGLMPEDHRCSESEAVRATDGHPSRRCPPS